MSFKQTFEKNLNKELEEDHQEPSNLYPPPLPNDLENQCPPPPPPPLPQVFPSYPEQRRGGMYIPTPLFILALLLLVFESSVLFVYTVVALYNTLPAPMRPMPDHQPINFAPNIMIPPVAAAISTQTITITITSTPSPTTITETLSTTLSASTTTISASTKAPVTVTKPAPTITVLSTVTPLELPSITTQTILSTESAPRSTVTSTSVVAAA